MTAINASKEKLQLFASVELPQFATFCSIKNEVAFNTFWTS